MKAKSIRLRLTLGVLLVLTPFLFALSHLLILARRVSHERHIVVVSSEPMSDSRPLLLILSSISVAAFGVGTWLIVGRTLSPIRNLAQQAKEADSEGREVTLHPSSPDPEVVELVDTLNDLMHRVTNAAESKGRFYAAASHELRTPLQALSGHLELATSRPRTTEEYRAAIDEAKVQTKRLVGLVEGILLLHRIDSDLDAPRERRNLQDVLHQSVAEQGVPVSILGDFQNVDVSGFSSHLEILIVNLLSNAVRHGGQPIEVQAEMGPAKSWIRMQISNRLAGGANPDVQELNEPFARVKRSRSGGAKGNGLGIAICRAICRANHWKIHFAVQGGTFVAQVEFPPEV